MAKTPDAVSNPQAYAQSRGIGGASADAGVRTHLLNHQRRKHIPEEWDGPAEETPPAARLTVDLGGERIRAVVRMVVTADKVLVELDRLPFGRSHGFKEGDFVDCARMRDGFGEKWLAARMPSDQKAIDQLDGDRAARLAAAEAAKRGEKPKRERRKVT